MTHEEQQRVQEIADTIITCVQESVLDFFIEEHESGTPNHVMSAAIQLATPTVCVAMIAGLEEDEHKRAVVLAELLANVTIMSRKIDGLPLPGGITA